MALRDWSDVLYLPILSLRPAEMRALEELPSRTKDMLVPVVQLRPWVNAYELDSATERLTQAFGDRPVVIAISDPEPTPPANRRPVHSQLDALRNPRKGFKQWCSFIEENDNYIPVLQFSADIQEEEVQISRLVELDRGIVVVIEKPAFPAMKQLARRVGDRASEGQDVCFVLDYGQVGPEHLNTGQEISRHVGVLRTHAPDAFVAVSASSIPDSFVGLVDQAIYERRLFSSLNMDNLIYSDRGSARVERQSGGGGLPAPRIDYPLPDRWKFFRADEQKGFAGYNQQARRLMKDDDWNPNLRVWGTQMIERTAAGDTSAIGSPQKATAARINLHLQRQAFYSTPGAAEDTDEDWSG